MIIHKKKFEPEVNCWNRFELPLKSKVLDIQVVDDEFCIWYSFESEYGDEYHYTKDVDIHCVFTGINYNMPSIELSYFKTVVRKGLVYHFFKEV